MKYRAIVEQDGTGAFNVRVPALPSLRAFGETQERALQAARDAIARTIEFDVESPAEPRPQPISAIQVNVVSGTVYQGGQPVRPRGVTLALMVALAIDPHEVSIDTLCARLYPNTPSEQAYNALKMAVHRARNQLQGQEFIETTTRGYCLSQDVIVDIRFLPQIVRAIRSRSVPKALEQRLADIFEDLARKRAPVFSTWEWFAPTEQLLRGAAREIGLYVGDRALRGGDAVLALEISRRLCAIDALDEAACELRMRSHLTLGDRASAVLEYHAYARRLSQGVGIEPPAALRRLIEVTAD